MVKQTSFQNDCQQDQIEELHQNSNESIPKTKQIKHITQELPKDKLGRLYRQFSRQKYTKYKHQFPRMRNAELVSKIIHQWEGLNTTQRWNLWHRFQEQEYLNVQDQSQSENIPISRIPSQAQLNQRKEQLLLGKQTQSVRIFKGDRQDIVQQQMIYKRQNDPIFVAKMMKQQEDLYNRPIKRHCIVPGVIDRRLAKKIKAKRSNLAKMQQRQRKRANKIVTRASEFYEFTQAIKSFDVSWNEIQTLWGPQLQRRRQQINEMGGLRLFYRYVHLTQCCFCDSKTKTLKRHMRQSHTGSILDYLCAIHYHTNGNKLCPICDLKAPTIQKHMKAFHPTQFKNIFIDNLIDKIKNNEDWSVLEQKGQIQSHIHPQPTNQQAQIKAQRRKTNLQKAEALKKLADNLREDLNKIDPNYLAPRNFENQTVKKTKKTRVFKDGSIRDQKRKVKLLEQMYQKDRYNFNWKLTQQQIALQQARLDDYYALPEEERRWLDEDNAKKQ